MFWRNLFVSKPFNSGYLPEADGHLVYYTEFGNPQGKPLLMLHGGPGGSHRAPKAKLANLRRYRVIMFDQRGCGQSLPLGKTDNNTTSDLLEDISRLLEHLKINGKIVLQGASWGSTLALLWAQKHPERVEKLLLSQIFLANDEARRWELDDAAYFYPEFIEQMNHASQDDITGYYNRLIQSDEQSKQLDAVNHYGWFERICCSLTPKFASFSEISPEQLAGNRIYMHYAAHKFFLGSNNILDASRKLKDIPVLIIHNRLDMVCPFKGAYDLHRSLNKSTLVIVPEFGHVGKLLQRTIRRYFKEELYD
ncbi:MAG: alpha/beta fold hydrolase [Alphaproteobacteria bacterium]|nr:alpha/beta fold hydrolase [Alphaproteobacteria bacterium]MBQ9235470.1 alpha/beta fold hydrolase [Alphaproteobacteria bacterium]